MPPDCIPSKLRPVRRAHNLTVVLLPEPIVKKQTQKMDSKLANSISYLELASCDSRVLEATDYETRCTHSTTGAAKKDAGNEAIS